MHPIGFIGHGFIGKHLADNFEQRGYDVVRYALEEPYLQNRAALADCDIVFVAVPTPTTPEGFDDSILRDVLSIPAAGSTVVIRSTVLPGTTKQLQADFPQLTLLHVPEFLREKQVREDTNQPQRTIVGLPVEDETHRRAAEHVRALLPPAPYTCLCDATEAELIKYGGNCFLALKVVFMNLLYDAAATAGADYEVVANALAADPRIGASHMQVLDESGHPGAQVGRGAGGHCFPKDLAAFAAWYAERVPDATGAQLLQTVEAKNCSLLRATEKDVDLLQAIYGRK